MTKVNRLLLPFLNLRVFLLSFLRCYVHEGNRGRHDAAMIQYAADWHLNIKHTTMDVHIDFWGGKSCETVPLEGSVSDLRHCIENCCSTKFGQYTAVVEGTELDLDDASLPLCSLPVLISDCELTIRPNADMLRKQCLKRSRELVKEAGSPVPCLDRLGELLDEGADVGYVSPIGTPLQAACNRGNVDAMRLLHSCGDDILATDTWSRTAMHHAVLGNSHEAMALVHEWGGALSTKDGEGRTPLTVARKYAYTRATEMLLGWGAY